MTTQSFEEKLKNGFNELFAQKRNASIFEIQNVFQHVVAEHEHPQSYPAESPNSLHAA